MDNRKTGQTTLRVSNQCSLEHTSQELANRLKKHLTIANPKYTAAKRYGRWIGKKMAPELYFFREEKDVFHFP
ncbi:MAG: hypothetical protein OEV64_12540, partial [Desulfobulbaceae bacterium]|nr:hypothetical protein [Desulfobulbaceae bacterium]